MKIGIGFPANIPGIEGQHLIEWAKKADAGPFSSLGLIDRLVYPNYEPLIAFAAAAGATQRIRLTTSVLLAPLRSAALLAKQAASLDALSGGRLTLGLGIGSREDDYQAVDVPFKKRGKIFDEQLATMHRIWSSERMSETVGPIGPTPVQTGGPEILIGGRAPAAIQRLAKWGNGYISGGGGPQGANEGFRIAEKVWREAGRAGQPRLVGCTYIALGPDGLTRGGNYIRDYYSDRGALSDMIARSLPTTLEAIKGVIQAYADTGADELILWPTTTDIEQVDQLADLLG